MSPRPALALAVPPTPGEAAAYAAGLVVAVKRLRADALIAAARQAPTIASLLDELADGLEALADAACARAAEAQA